MGETKRSLILSEYVEEKSSDSANFNHFCCMFILTFLMNHYIMGYLGILWDIVPHIL